VTKRRRHEAAHRARTRTQSHARDVYAHDRAGLLSPVVRHDPARIYVPNSDSNSVDVIDPTTLRVVAHFGVGALPHHVTPAYDLRTL
jgi:YVTN family beta-propeller protein